MKRMVELQQQVEECSQEEMITRFERERSESIPTGTHTPPHLRTRCLTLWLFSMAFFLTCVCVCVAVGRGAPSDLVLRLVEDAELIYQDCSIRGEQSPPTLRAQGGGCVCVSV